MTKRRTLTPAQQERLIYFDREFVAGRYEIETGEPASTQISKAQGGKAGANFLAFAADVSATETRSFPVSTLQMLATVLPAIEKSVELDPEQFKSGMPSMTGWVEGELTVMTAQGKKLDGTPTTELYSGFRIHGGPSPALNLSLITVPTYFTSGIDALTRMQQTVLAEMSIPTRAFVRVLATRSHFEMMWIAVPYVMLESHGPT